MYNTQQQAEIGNEVTNFCKLIKSIIDNNTEEQQTLLNNILENIDKYKDIFENNKAIGSIIKEANYNFIKTNDESIFNVLYLMFGKVAQNGIIIGMPNNDFFDNIPNNKYLESIKMFIENNNNKNLLLNASNSIFQNNIPYCRI